MIDRSKQCRFLAFFGDRTLGFFDGGVTKSPNWRTQTLDRLSESGTISSARVPKLRPRHQRSSGLVAEWRCFKPRKEPSEVSALEWKPYPAFSLAFVRPAWLSFEQLRTPFCHSVYPRRPNGAAQATSRVHSVNFTSQLV
jgi:hypothetical protein